MLSVSKLLDSAVARHRAGRLGEAEALYKQILLIEPGHADSLHLLGVLAGEVDKSRDFRLLDGGRSGYF